MISDKHAAIFFPLFEACIQEDVLRVWLRNTGASIGYNDGSNICADRLKDILSHLRIEI